MKTHNRLIMPVSESQWAFDAAESQYTNSLYLVAVFVITGLFLLFKRIQKVSKILEKPRPPYGLICLIVASLLFNTFYRDIHKMRRILACAKETIGITQQSTYSNKTRKYPFHYEVNGKVLRQDDVRAQGKQLTWPGGSYIVIYNSEDPSEAFMDVRRPVTDTLPVD